MKNTALVINSKGSVGKTPISFNLAYDLDMNIITNDKSALIACYKDRTTLTNQLELMENSLYDCGGFSAPGILNIVEQVNIIIVPVFNDPSSLIQTRDTLKQILPLAKKVVIVTTKTENKLDSYAEIRGFKWLLNDLFLAGERNGIPFFAGRIANKNGFTGNGSRKKYNFLNTENKIQSNWPQI